MQLAQPCVPWQGVKNATQFGNACPQFDVITKKFIGEEDCLYLNVYTPVIKNVIAYFIQIII
jgi:carboxylesterase type B